MFAPRPCAPTALAALALAAPAFAGTLTVGPPASGATYADIQSAIDAAAPGDVILVEPGTYDRFRLDKGVRIVATVAGAVEVRVDAAHADYMCAEIADVPLGQVAEVSGVSFLADGGGAASIDDPFPPVVHVHDNLGLVALQQVALQPGHVTPNSGYIGPALVVEDSAIVQLHDVVADGPMPFLGLAQPAARVTNSEVWMQTCALRGAGPQVVGAFFPAKDGQVALEASDAVVYVARSSFVGGDGGYTFVPDPFGGIDLHVHFNAPAVRVTGDSVLKLAGGPGSSFVEGHLDPGGPVASASGANPLGAVEVHDTGLVAYTLQLPMDPPLPAGLYVGPNATGLPVPFAYPTLGAASWTAQPGGGIALDLHGNPGALGLLFGSGAPAPPIGLPSIDGAAGMDLSTLLFLGTHLLDPSGHASPVLAVPANPTLVGKTLVSQWLESGGPQLAVSNPAQVVVRP